MNKDSFYYKLLERKEYAKEYSVDMRDYLLSFKLTDKVDKAVFKVNFLFFIIIKIFYLPTHFIRSYEYLKGYYFYNRSIKEIDVINEELKKYEK